MAPVETTHDYYSIIGVSNTASIEVIRKSYIKQARDLHPDKNPNKPDATAAFQLVSL
jgi:molecular chaperone DnaJ